MKRTDMIATLRRLAFLFFPFPFSLFLLSSCLDDDSLEQSDDYLGTFEACWQTLDQRYCYFEEKQVDWDAIYRRYQPYVRDSVDNQVKLLAVLDQMLDTLKDGHVNVYAPFNTARYSQWYDDYPTNYDANLVQQYYLGTNYWTASGMQYGRFGRDSVAYIRYSSFDATIGPTNLDYVLAALGESNGLIIDVRNNGGGSLSNVPTLAGRFCTEKTLYCYISHKTGPGHRDFSQPEPIYLEPAEEGRSTWDASTYPVVVLTNRHSYSATNNFVQAMLALDGTLTTDSVGQQHPKMIKVCGDRTGGGSGMPFESVLPNGWPIRFSACPMLDKDRHSTEMGIDPSEGLKVDMDSTTMIEKHRDDIIEAARDYIMKNTRAQRAKPVKDHDDSLPHIHR